MALIDELYAHEDCERIKAIYKDDVESRSLLMQAFGRRIIDSDKILTSKPLDILVLMCMTADFADSMTECQTVAVILHKHLLSTNPLPYILDDHGFALAEKTLVSLAFFLPAMQWRCKFHGAPSPEFYRRASKLIFSKHNHNDIAEHHEKWESFCTEMFL